MAHDLGIAWFRRDLRLDDNPAWAAATTEHGRVLPLFVVDPWLLDRAGDRRAARLLGDVGALDRRLAEHGARLCVRVGDPVRVVAAEAERRGATAVHVNDDVTPYAARRDGAVREALAALGVGWRSQWGGLVHEPGRVRTASGGLSQVFTPFFRAWSSTRWSPWPEPGGGVPLDDPGDPPPVPLVAYPLLDGDEGAAAEPGEAGAAARLDSAAQRADRYDAEHDRPDLVGTSLLSPDLRFGTLSPRTVVEVVGESSPGRAALVRQIAWRDWFAHHLRATPSMPHAPMRTALASLRWRDDPDDLEAWRAGATGVPLVDAGMRQLLATGWMHNRVRMVVASFLVKNLLIDWRLGERWFRHLLIDGDVAQNVGNWQWVAGTGLDAAPYDRIFNPVRQGERFDPDGAYVRRWVPELAGLPAPGLHSPWTLGPLELAAAGIVLGDTYPAPIVDLAESRARALAAYGAARR